jgi:hypothetical protein
MRKMVVRASGPGGGNSIFRSMRPGRNKAESRISKVDVRASFQITTLHLYTYSVSRHDDLLVREDDGLD